jgi:uncharacterized protein
MKQEIRKLTVEVRAGAKDDAFELNGCAVSYNVLSQDLGGFRERIAPGCFTRALASNPDVKMLFNHDNNYILGRTTNSTLQLFDTPAGLNFRCKLNPESQAHRDLYSSIKRQDISQCSFAFKPDADGDQFEDVKDERGAWFVRRTVKAAQIFDCSVVTQPAYNAPGATSVIARSSAVPRQNPFERARRRNSVSLEERFRQQTGLDYHRLQTVALQISTEALVLDADRRLREKLEAQGRQIRAQQMIQEMKEGLE